MVSAIDSTLPQFTMDAGLVLLVAVNAYAGWRTGSLRRFLALAGLYAGFLAAYYAGNSFAIVFRRGDVVANGWAFIAVLVTMILLVELLGQVFADRIKHIAALSFDRIAGTLLGATVGFFEVLMLFLVALAVGAPGSATGHGQPALHDGVSNAVRGAAISGQAIRAEPALRAAFAPIIGTDLGAHLGSGSQATAMGG